MDLVFLNGIVLTQDGARPVAEAVAVADGRIAAVGARHEVEPLGRAGTRRVDLGGRALLPGFDDAHCHVWKIGQLLTSVLDVRRADSLGALQEALRAFAAGLPDGAWCLARGYNEARLREGRGPDRHDLDAAVPDRPVCLTRTCGHIVVANTRALRLARIASSTEPPPGGRIERNAEGGPTGVLAETAMGLVTRHVPTPRRAEYEAMIRAAHRRLLALGITSAGDCGVLPEVLDAYRALEHDGALAVRANVMPLRRRDGSTANLPFPERFVSDRLRVDTVKLFADGGLSGHTAALSQPYRGTDSRGVLRLPRAELAALIAESHAAGWRVATHAIGDAAIEELLAAYESLPAALPGDRIEHLGLPTRDHLRRAAALHLAVATQAVFLPALGANLRAGLPPELADRVYPLRAMRDAGLAIALSSDAPVVEDENPFLGVQAAVLRRDHAGEPFGPGEALGTAEALYAYTRGGAVLAGTEARRGSIAPGKRADLVVVSADPLAVEPEGLTELRVDMAFVDGRLVHEA